MLSKATTLKGYTLDSRDGAIGQVTEESLLTREYETALHRHYQRQGYWVEAPAAKAPA